MAYQYPEIKKFLGLFAQANSFGLPDGAMETAMNVVINDDDVLQKVRGFYQYFAPVSGTLKALFTFQNRLMALYTDKIAYYTDTGSSPNEVGTETVLTGQAFTISSDRVPIFVEANGNLYWTTDNGVMKLDAYNGTVFLAGAPPALDIRGNLLPVSGIFDGDSQISYRAVFGRRDANQNLILGAPSDVLILTNVKTIAVAYTSTGAGPYTVTVTSPNHGLTTGMQIVVTDATDLDANGTYVITVTGTNTFTYVTVANPASGTLSYAASKTPLIEFSIPSEITSSTEGWFWQLYRTSESGDDAVSPPADWRLVEEKPLTSADITTGFIVFQDQIDQVLVEFAPELYTNPNSREGELQANLRPPLCEDITTFNNYMMFGNCETRQFVDVDVVDTAALNALDFVEIKVDAVTRRYYAKEGIGNRTVRIDGSFAGDTVTYTAHGFTDDDSVFVNTVTGSLTPGLYYIITAAANTFQLALTKGGAAVSLAGTTSFYLQGVTTEVGGTDYPMFQLDNVSGNPAAELRNTAQGLVRAVNRDDSSVVYGNYISQITDIPGKMRFTAKGFGGIISLRTNGLPEGLAFFPALPDSFSTGTQVTSTNDVQPNVVYSSKLGEPEAVPVVNFYPVGSRNQELKRLLALRNAVVILKQDGVFKITGDNPSNFTVTAMDNTIKVISPASAVATDNRVFFLATEGICIATDSSVEIISRRIENRIEPIVGQPTVVAETAAVGYDSDRTYRISTLLPNETTKTITYYYNTVNDTWTESDVLFSAGAIGPNDVLYLISDNKILKERKKGNRIDFTMQNWPLTVTSVAVDKLSAVVSVGSEPMPGDIIVKGSVITRISGATSLGGNNYTVTFRRETNLVAADSVIMYERIVSQMGMAPYHGGAIGRAKQYAQLQLHTRTPSISRIAVTFTGQTFGGSESTEWLAELVAATGGWGQDPWGFFAWGQSDGILNQYKTLPAPVVRLYVPLFQQRNTFIQTFLVHREGGEAIDLQAMCWAIRAYQERVTR